MYLVCGEEGGLLIFVSCRGCSMLCVSDFLSLTDDLLISRQPGRTMVNLSLSFSTIFGLVRINSITCTVFFRSLLDFPANTSTASNTSWSIRTSTQVAGRVGSDRIQFPFCFPIQIPTNYYSMEGEDGRKKDFIRWKWLSASEPPARHYVSELCST